MINNKDEMFIKANSHVNIVSIQRDGEYYTIELNYPDNEDREVKMLECVVVQLEIVLQQKEKIGLRMVFQEIFQKMEIEL